MSDRNWDGLRIGFVCGALRVTTNEHSDCVGPRAHVVGFLAGLRDNGVRVDTYLAGDRVPAAARRATSERSARGGWTRRVGVDVARLGLRQVTSRRASAVLGPDPHLLYERQASFQDIGRRAKRRGVPWVIESNGPFWYEADAERHSLGLPRQARRLEIDAYRDADLVVAVSEELKSIIVSETGRAAQDVLVVPNATDPHRFDPGKKAPRRPGHRVTIGFCGYLADWAGVDLLLRAAARLRRSGTDVDVVVVGDGPAAESLQSLALSEGIADRTTFTGNVPWSSIPSLLGGLDLAYSGQRTMSIGSMYHSPLKLYEYLAMGVPVVASAFKDARLLTATGAGWLFEPDDVDDLTDVLREAVEATDRHDRGLAGRELIVAEHSWAARTSTLLHELADRGLVPSPAALAKVGADTSF